MPVQCLIVSAMNATRSVRIVESTFVKDKRASARYRTPASKQGKPPVSYELAARAILWAAGKQLHQFELPSGSGQKSFFVLMQKSGLLDANGVINHEEAR